MNTCLKCGVATKNKKYCSRSCANSINNTTPKRKMKKTCSHEGCNTLIRSDVNKCSEHSRTVKDITLGEAMYKKQHRSSVFALVRSRARAAMKDSLQVCEHCSYDKHVEVCHIKGVSEFSEDALLSEINNKDNLKLLCPNCHWEFDNLTKT